MNVGAATRPHPGAFSGQHKAAPLGITRRHEESCEKEGFFLAAGKLKKWYVYHLWHFTQEFEYECDKEKKKKTLPPRVRASLVKGEDMCRRCYGAVVFA